MIGGKSPKEQLQFLSLRGARDAGDAAVSSSHLGFEIAASQAAPAPRDDM
jgi:hypothetical protein